MKKILLIALFSICSLSISLAQIPKDSLVAYYYFNGNTDDGSGNNKHAAVNGIGVTLTTNRFSTANSAYSFDGSDGDITANIGQISSEISISFWYLSGVQTKDYPHFIDYGDYRIRCHLMSGSIYNATDRNAILYETYNLSSNELRGGQKPGDNTWTHVVITFSKSANAMKIYINGVLDKQKFITGNDLALNDGVIVFGRVRTGSTPNINTTRFKGKLDDIYIYSKELNQQEITALFDGDNIQSTGEKAGKSIISVYPNPFSENLTINVSNENSTFMLTDVTGKMVHEGTASETINTSTLAEGVYILSVFENGELKSTEKVLKQ